MDPRLGALQLLPALEHLDLVATPTAGLLQTPPGAESVRVCTIDPELSDTAAFCAHYGTALEVCGNCVILEATRGERTWYAACVIPGSTRADVNGLARRTLGARKVSFAPMATAVELTGMEYGAITPVGLPTDWSILLDGSLVENE